jgi:hypothetical protein
VDGLDPHAEFGGDFLQLAEFDIGQSGMQRDNHGKGVKIAISARISNLPPPFHLVSMGFF